MPKPKSKSKSKAESRKAPAGNAAAPDLIERIADALERLAPQRAERARISTPPMPSSGSRTDAVLRR